MSLIWFEWSLLFLAGWILLFLLTKENEVRREVVGASLAACVFGFTEPIFVPRYWDPPSLFNLAQTTGFDLESFIFTFAVGGIVVGLFERLFSVRHRPLEPEDTRFSQAFSLGTITAAMVLLFTIVVAFSPVNPIYAAIGTLFSGGILALWFRPDLTKKMVVSMFLFAALYVTYFLYLVFAAPGYVTSVWDLRALSGVLISGIPLEEILFALGFGFFWSGIYDLYAWRRVEISGLGYISGLNKRSGPEK